MILSDDFYHKHITIDRADTRIVEDFFAKEGDANSRGMIVQLTERGVELDTTGVILRLQWQHLSVGNDGFNDFEVVDATKGIYKLTYSSAMLNTGKVEAMIRIQDGTAFYGTRNFFINVERMAGSEDSIVGSNDYSSLQKALSAISNGEGFVKPMENACLFYGNPKTIKGSTTVNEAATFYSKYDIVIFNGNIEEETHPYHADTAEIVTKLKGLNPKVQVFGYIHSHDPSISDNGSSQPFLTIPEVSVKAGKWKNLIGATGIFLDAFGYDYSVTRVRQRELVSTVKEYGMNVIVNSWMPDYVFSDKNFTVSGGLQTNPDGLPPLVDENDYYIFENHVYRRSYYTNDIQEANDSERIYQGIYYRSVPQEEYGGMSFYDKYKTKTISLNGLEELNERFYTEAYLIALATGCHAFSISGKGWSDPDYPDFEPPKLKGVSGEYKLESYSHPNDNQLSLKAKVGDNVLDIQYDQPDTVKNIYEFPNTPFVFKLTLGGALNVNSSIQVVLNGLTYYPAGLLGDTAEVLATKIAAFNYGSEWTARAEGSDVYWTYVNGNPEKYGTGSDGGNYMYLNVSKGVTYSYVVVSTAFRVVRRITLNSEFLHSKSGPGVLKPPSPNIGYAYYNTDTNETTWYDGSEWQPLSTRILNPDSGREVSYVTNERTSLAEGGRFSTTDGTPRTDATYMRAVSYFDCVAGTSYKFENNLGLEMYLLFYVDGNVLLKGWREGNNYAKVDSGASYTAIVGSTSMRLYVSATVGSGVTGFTVTNNVAAPSKPISVFEAQYFNNHKLYESAGKLMISKLDSSGNFTQSISVDDLMKVLNNSRGTTAQRPTVPHSGFCYLDTTLNKPVWYTGSGWVDAAGVSV